MNIFSIIAWVGIGVGLYLIGLLIKDQKDLIETNENRKCTIKDYKEILINLYRGEEFYYEDEESK